MTTTKHGSRIAYYRVSTSDQSIESQRAAMAGGGAFDQEFIDEGVSGSVMAASRKGFAALLAYIREGDTLYVYAVDRLGRDALDVQSTVRALIDKGVTVDVHKLGPMARGVGELILAVLAQVADMERRKIIERTEAGRVTARDHLQRTGKTHKGKFSMGRPAGAVGSSGEGRHVDPSAVVEWRKANGVDGNPASIAVTAKHFDVSLSTVKRYTASGI
jgi:putative DNA-invertase from lambdoid prophage Rac